jgi:hypothetical protein
LSVLIEVRWKITGLHGHGAKLFRCHASAGFRAFKGKISGCLTAKTDVNAGFVELAM